MKTRSSVWVGFLTLSALAAAVCAQAGAPGAPGGAGGSDLVPVTPKVQPPTLPPMGPVVSAPITEETRKVLQMLHDRKSTLKDFTADIDYNVDDPRGGATGKTGTMSYIMDATVGPTFSVDFDWRTVDGVPKLKFPAQIIFDGKVLTEKDWGALGNAKTFMRQTLVKPGDKPGTAVSLQGPLPLPIGVEVSEVVNSFDVTGKESKNANQAILQLVPHADTSFDYKKLVLTVDLKEQLPVKLERTERDNSVTTITLTNVHSNDGKAKMLDDHTPKAEGWAPKANSEPAKAPG